MEIIAIISTIATVIAAIFAWPAFRQWLIDRKQPKIVKIQTERLKVLAVIPAPMLGAEGNTPPAVRLDIGQKEISPQNAQAPGRRA